MTRIGRKVCVLSGGALKAVSQLGILAYFEERGLRFDSYIGCSGGAIIAAMMASGLIPREAMNILLEKGMENLNFLDPVFYLKLLPGFLGHYRSGMADAGSIGAALKEVLPFDVFDDLPVELIINAVNLREGNEVYFTGSKSGQKGLEGSVCRRLTISRAVSTSICLPLVFNPLQLDECRSCGERTCGLPEEFSGGSCYFIDGGFVSHLPLKPALYPRTSILAINIRLEGSSYDKDPSRWKLTDTLIKSADILLQDKVKRSLGEKLPEGTKILYLSPPVWDSGFFEVDDMGKSFRAGWETARMFVRSIGLEDEGDLDFEQILTLLKGAVTIYEPHSLDV